MNKKVIYCSKISDIPKEDHFAIIIEDSVYEHDPYDERGGGYNSPCLKYQAFLDKADWEEAIRELTISSYSKKNFKAVFVQGFSVDIKISVSVK